MTKLEQANEKKLSELLAKEGYRPVPGSGDKQWYYSPFHAENNPSFCIRRDGKWKDYSINPEGLYQSNVDFVVQYYKVSVSEAIKKLLDEDIHLSKHEPKPVDDRPYYDIVGKEDISSHFLLPYLKKRCIPLDIARKYCVQLLVKYPKSARPDQIYKAIGFENMSEGYEIRNSFQKMTLTPNNISKLEGSNQELVFEGFFNFLSYVALYGDTERTVYVLNGTGNWQFIKNLNDAEYWGDNGCHYNNIEEKWVYPGDVLLGNLPGKVRDMRWVYRPYEDLNDYLCDKGKVLWG